MNNTIRARDLPPESACYLCGKICNWRFVEIRSFMDGFIPPNKYGRIAVRRVECIHVAHKDPKTGKMCVNGIVHHER